MATHILRWTVGILLISSIGLKEDSEKKVQSRLENLWLTMAYGHEAAVSKTTAFLRVIAKATGTIFDRVFGKRLFSIRGVLVSVCFSIASFFLCVQLLSFFPKTPPASFEIWLLTFAFLFLACAPALLLHSNNQEFWIWWGVFVLFIVLRPLFQFLDFLRTTGAKGAGLVISPRGLAVFIVVITVISTASDFCYIALTRWMLRKASELKHWFGIIGIVFLDCLLALMLVVGPIILGILLIAKEIPRDNLGHLLVSTNPQVTPLSMFGVGIMLAGPTLNTIDALACLLFFVLMVVMLLHRILWPILETPVYAFQRYGLISHKGWLVSVGVALIFGDSIWKALLELAGKL